jgi:hypothetical protein
MVYSSVHYLPGEVPVVLDWPARETAILDRGDRYAVVGTAYQGAYDVVLVDSQEAAEAAEVEMRGRGLRRIHIYPPQSDPNATDSDLDTLGARYAALRTQVAELRNLMRRAAIRAIEADESETSVAKRLRVDRMTVRYWRDKR